MKTAILPPVRLDPKQKALIEAAMVPGETLSAFMLEAVLSKAEARRAQAAFVAKGLAAERDAERESTWVSEEAVFSRLEATLKRAQRKAKKR
jgi:uncharacterized protein (DUF1778 family)